MLLLRTTCRGELDIATTNVFITFQNNFMVFGYFTEDYLFVDWTDSVPVQCAVYFSTYNTSCLRVSRRASKVMISKF